MDFSNILWDLDGTGIERESFRRIDAETPPEARAKFSEKEWHVARRLVHTGADFSLLDILEFSPGAVEAGHLWLAALALIMSMVAAFYYLTVARVMYADEPIYEEEKGSYHGESHFGFVECDINGENQIKKPAFYALQKKIRELN